MHAADYFTANVAKLPRTLVFGAADRCDETARRCRMVRDGRYRYLRNFTPEVALLPPNARR